MSERWFSWKQISRRCWVASGDGGNSLLIACDGEAVLVDTKMPGFGGVLRREAEAICGTAIRTVINTHHHRDHVGGNDAFTHDCVVLMHENGIERVRALGGKIEEAVRNSLVQVREDRRDADGVIARELEAISLRSVAIETFVPNRIVRRSETLTIGGVRIELLHFGAGHSDNDLVVWIPSENVVHSGDLIFNHAWPYVDRGGGMKSAGWIAGCERVFALCNEKTIVVPGHGEIDDREAAMRQAGILRRLRRESEEAVRNGVLREDFLALPLEEFGALANAAKLKPMALGGFWDEAGGLSPP